MNPSETSGSSVLRIYVVENHADTAAVLSQLLKSMGHIVAVAGDLATALRDLPAFGCDLLICDVHLPDGDGWQLLKQLSEPLPKYAVAMSGHYTSLKSETFSASGFTRHLFKPFTQAQVRELVEAAVKNELLPTEVFLRREKA